MFIVLYHPFYTTDLFLSFYIAWKHEKTSDFPVFSGCVEKDQWHEMV